MARNVVPGTRYRFCDSRWYLLSASCDPAGVCRRRWPRNAKHLKTHTCIPSTR
jgi:hypothetical protein